MFDEAIARKCKKTAKHFETFSLRERASYWKFLAILQLDVAAFANLRNVVTSIFATWPQVRVNTSSRTARRK